MTRYRTYGNGPCSIVLVHGGPGAPGSLGPLARGLADRLRVCALTGASEENHEGGGGRGQSSTATTFETGSDDQGTDRTHLVSIPGILEPFQTAHAIDALVAELAESILQHARSPVCIVGHSWGAWLSVIFAATHPHLVKRLVLVSSGPFEDRYVSVIRGRRLHRLGPVDFAEYEALLASLESKEHERERGNADRDMLRLSEHVRKSDNFASCAAIDADADDTVPGLDGSAYGAIWAEASEMRKSGRLMGYVRKLACPVLALHGKDDPHPYEGVIGPLIAVLERFEYELFDRCGHYPWNEPHARDRFFDTLMNACS